MGTPYPLEKKNQILGRILSKEITVEQAHREYSIATSCVYRWLRQLKADCRSGGQGTQAIPLPQSKLVRACTSGRQPLRQLNQGTHSGIVS